MVKSNQKPQTKKRKALKDQSAEPASEKPPSKKLSTKPESLISSNSKTVKRLKSNFENAVSGVDLNETTGEEEITSETFYPYLIVKGKAKNKRARVIRLGVTCDPYKRFLEQKLKYKFASDVRMLIVMQCSVQNLPPKIGDPFVFGRTVEYIFESINFPNLMKDTKAGDGATSSKYPKILASSMIGLKKVVHALVDTTLEDDKEVTEVDHKGSYKCNTCGIVHETQSAQLSCRRKHQKGFTCKTCGLEFDSRGKREYHYKSDEHLEQKDKNEQNKANKKKSSKKDRKQQKRKAPNSDTDASNTND